MIKTKRMNAKITFAVFLRTIVAEIYECMVDDDRNVVSVIITINNLMMMMKSDTLRGMQYCCLAGDLKDINWSVLDINTQIREKNITQQKTRTTRTATFV